MKRTIATAVITAVVTAAIAIACFAGCAKKSVKQTASAYLDQEENTVEATVDLTDGYSCDFARGAIYLYDQENKEGVDAVAIGISLGQDTYNDYLAAAKANSNSKEINGGIMYQADGQMIFIQTVGTSAYFGVFADNAGADIHACLRDALDGAVAQSAGSVDLAVVVDVGVGDFARVDDFHPVADGAALWHAGLHLLADEVEDDVHELLVAVVVDHECGQLAGEAVEEHHVAVAHLVEHADEVALAEGGSLGRLYRVDVIVTLRRVVLLMPQCFTKPLLTSISFSKTPSCISP